MAPMPPHAAVKEMGDEIKRKQELQKWLDENQYSRNGILRYERIFGKTFVSTGGAETTSMLTKDLGLTPDMKVLDIACGIGGSAFLMAREYGVQVHGVDLSTNMLGIAKEYREQSEPDVKHRVQFHMEDVTTMSYPDSFYDLVYSRDAIMHIEDKRALYKNFYNTLKPGGQLLVTDYCWGNMEHTEKFLNYVAQRNYHLLNVEEYGKILESVGFKNVKAVDKTDLMVEVMYRELADFHKIKDEFVKEFSQEDFDWIVKGWEDKIPRCKAGQQVWGLFTATK